MFDPIYCFQDKYKLRPSVLLKPFITDSYCVDEDSLVQQLLPLAKLTETNFNKTASYAKELISSVREDQNAVSFMDQLLLEFSLNTEEGIALMCLAEALLRIPDSETAESFIADKLANLDWIQHFGTDHPIGVNTASWSLLLGSQFFLHHQDKKEENPIQKIVNRVGETLTRKALETAIGMMGRHFVMGQTIEEALDEANKQNRCCSFDMLGEAALTQDDADTYFQAYMDAIQSVANQKPRSKLNHSISIKLSALHPRYEESQRTRVLKELYSRVLTLVKHAFKFNIAVTIDAEEMDRFELYLDLFEQVLMDSDISQWGQLGIVIQAYSKRALPSLLWLNALGRELNTTIPVRLVKGAYWDNEIKLCQQIGLNDYTVFTRKETTDLSYLVCANYLLSEYNESIKPQFATHNAQTISSLYFLAKRHNVTHLRYELQRLHGMGEVLHQLNSENSGASVRVYAPVGQHRDLLPYLVRRLLENGVNSSFIHQTADCHIDIEKLCKHPYHELSDKLIKNEPLRNNVIPKPPKLYTDRDNSLGLNLNSHQQRHKLFDQLKVFQQKHYHAQSLSPALIETPKHHTAIYACHSSSAEIGTMSTINESLATDIVEIAKTAYEEWRLVSVENRSKTLENMANHLQEKQAELIHLLQVEAGKTLPDAIDEIREAIDFCRYYASEARKLFAKPVELKGPTGELNTLHYYGRGPFVCISPWNFPLAIFNGQIAAALVTGNTVIAKPASDTPLIAHFSTELWYRSGVPQEVLQLCLGSGSDIGNTLTQHEDIAGVCFTGSSSAAKQININLAQRNGPIVPLIAETGGQNTMIVDSTALPEQVVKDVLRSSFQSAGQRCSALRVLYLQNEIADGVINELCGAVAELNVGSPLLYSSDIGPLINQHAKQTLVEHIQALKQSSRLIYEGNLEKSHAQQHYLAPHIFEIESLSQLTKEHFGPILHIIRYEAKDIDTIISDINDSAYGLTLGIHSRNMSFVEHIEQHVHVGNVYVNRNQVGAVVGVQPFGGEKLSGTGPKAGGPNYLMRFITEQTRSTNLSATGGNTDLLNGET